MRRLAGVVLSAILLALVPALLPSIAPANTLAPAGHYQFGLAAFRALFGESSDAGATLAAAYGDRASESPLRDLAMTSRPGATRMPYAVTALPGSPTFVSERTRRTTIDAPGLTALGSVYAPSSTQFVPVAFYAPVPALPIDPPRRLDGAGVAPVSQASASDAPAPDYAAPPRIAFGTAPSVPKSGALAAAFDPPTQLVPVSMHVGRLQFDGSVGGTQTQTSSAFQQDDAYGAGANFDVRAGSRRLNVDVTSGYEHLLRDDASAYSTALPTAAQWNIGGDATPALPSYADMSKLALGANIAVPVTHTMTLNLNYNAQRLLGEYGLPGIGNLDATDNSYGGNVTFAIPRWSSQLSVSASQYHYQDYLAPANTFSDLRGNVDFTVKF